MKFETENLIISEFTTDDALFIIELFNEPSYIKNIRDKGVRTIEEAKKHIEDVYHSVYKTQEYGYYKVALKDSNTPIGTCGLMKRDGLDCIDIGFAYLKKYRGKGYAFEAAKCVLDFGLNNLKIQKIAAITTYKNDKSANLIERLGLRYEKDIRIPNDDELLRMFSIERK